MNEGPQWLEINGFENYLISNDGKVYSKISKKVLSPSVSPRGYLIIKLGSHKAFSVHRLVAMTFVKNDHNKPQINHIDGNPLNNIAENLEWVTQSENQKHAILMGLQKYPAWTEERRKRLSSALTGHACTTETRDRISQAKKGKHIMPFTDDHKRKISEALKRRNVGC